MTPTPITTDRPTATAPLILGGIGLVFGLIPLTFLIALGLGVIGLALGISAWRTIPRPRLARTGTLMSLAAIALGCVGAYVMAHL